MIFKFLHRLGVPSDAAYLAGVGSIAVSIVAWAWRNEDNAANAERLGIFIGLWAPTFMLLGNGLKQEELAKGMQSPALESASQRIEDAGERAGRRVQEAVGAGAAR